uniref:Activating transcription factor 1 n=1 Tax=Nomascus leucogenys TaxID=61853 RepID=A0A2I3GVB4_NOMLE
MEDSHKSTTSETAPQPGSAVQGAHISHIAQQLPLPQMEPYSWQVQAQMDYRDFRH